jgi:hypothetical protein
MWPSTTPFGGPPILRGLLWVDAGELRSPGDVNAIPFLELRDGEAPIALVANSPLMASLGGADQKDAALRILVRPDAVSVCMRPGAARAGAAGATRGVPPGARYEALGENAQIEVERVRLRFVPIHAPAWIDARAGR